MIFNLSEQNSIANHFIAEIRDAKIQQDSMRFRRNLERIGEVLAYEISKELEYEEKNIETPLGVAKVNVQVDKVVLATILRAGLPLHHGMLNYFDRAGNAFVSAYRKHHKDGTFDIHLEYISCPVLEDAILIVSDPMLATGASMSLSTKALLEFGQPKQIHFATAIASQAGLDHMRRLFPDAYVWMAALDEELTGKAYIVPGLGDAGDLSYGDKGVGTED
ncbi:MAG: uracil phosphoribosyltransferase [Phaeodactylibacter sp.]|nr:uracil phosphoribosyltransferase [Phaeodactylibacter sp.]